MVFYEKDLEEMYNITKKPYSISLEQELESELKVEEEIQHILNDTEVLKQILNETNWEQINVFSRSTRGKVSLIEIEEKELIRLC
eukprot:CAMPEP_0201590944 /NCGR_PEP_ID=MMETSP0190_2-20130828/183584_1 /ASSEMBLY_ACC=CAM_ASM_000263 /TAXON_ID=37353 /ORGANISM="Rosalina sp." /LENGTH=84 /DNA_ID=CAMNT_0048048143 /DNA_START=20 /DNA_END=271 /DNA_ORIENTATION=+